MRTAGIRALALGLLLAAAGGPARAEGTVYTLGSSLGLDVYHQEYGSYCVLSTTPGSPLLFPAEPGLRLGMVLPGERAEFAVLMGMTVISTGEEAVSALGCTLEGNYAFAGDREVRPYLGVHAGIARSGLSSGEGTGLTNVGAQIGVRRMVSGGHGAVRLELRGSALGGDAGTGMTDLGVRVGYDLWFR